MGNLATKRDELQTQKATLVGYMASKMRSCVFHAVQDAASDIREIDAKLEILSELEAGTLVQS